MSKRLQVDLVLCWHQRMFHAVQRFESGKNERKRTVSQWCASSRGVGAAYTKHLLSCARQPLLENVSLKPVEKGKKGEKTLRNEELKKMPAICLVHFCTWSGG